MKTKENDKKSMMAARVGLVAASGQPPGLPLQKRTNEPEMSMKTKEKDRKSWWCQARDAAYRTLCLSWLRVFGPYRKAPRAQM